MPEPMPEAMRAIERLRARYPHPTGTNYHLDLDIIEREHAAPRERLEKAERWLAEEQKAHQDTLHQLAAATRRADEAEAQNAAMRQAIMGLSEDLREEPEFAAALSGQAGSALLAELEQWRVDKIADDRAFDEVTSAHAKLRQQVEELRAAAQKVVDHDERSWIFPGKCVSCGREDRCMLKLRAVLAKGANPQK